MKNAPYTLLKKKIINRKAVVGVVGIGTVGLPLAKSVASSGFETIGFDIYREKVASVNKLHHKNLSATNKFSYLLQCDIICICVPTPITYLKKPDLSFVKKAVRTVSKYLKNGQLIILESSVSVGTTRKIVYSKLACSAKKKSCQFFLAYSPERIDIGNKTYTISNTPKIVSGIDKKSLVLSKSFYKTFVKKVIPASSLETAELAKLFENTFRLVNISLVHEVARYAKKANIDIWEMIDVARSKPFGFLAHFPGPGVGGHCIPVDPYYLFDDAKKNRVSLSLVSSALSVNKKRPVEIVRYAQKIVRKKDMRKRRVLLIGISYKANVSDCRESAGIVIWKLLEKNGWEVSYHDPFVPIWNKKKSKKLSSEMLNAFDLIIITTNHKSIDYKIFKDVSIPVVDTRNALKQFKKQNIFRI